MVFQKPDKIFCSMFFFLVSIPHENGVFGIGKVDDIDTGDFKLLANRSCNEIVLMEVDCLVYCRSIMYRGKSSALNILHKILLGHLHITSTQGAVWDSQFKSLAEFQFPTFCKRAKLGFM